MSRIKSKYTKPEKLIFSELRKRKIRFTKHPRELIGSPDLILLKKKIAIFIHGDFWHGWQFPRWKAKLSSPYWRDKIENNRRRDRGNIVALRRLGWSVLVIWEHRIEKNKITAINQIIKLIK
jgi:DNA mismatch endonuclease (patch repair protein)